MIARLRSLSPPLRFAVYVAGALVLFFLAVGVGAAAAFVMGRQFDSASTGASGTTTLEGSGLETTGTAAGSENTAVEPSTGEDPGDGVETITFTHHANDENSRGDYTYISNSSINGRANAVVLVSPSSDRGDPAATAYQHNIGVWYESKAQKWAIFNQDLAPVPAGSTFEVVVPPASSTIVHHAELLNTAGHYTYVDNRLTNGRPNAVLAVTQNWNPGGGRGVYNNHPVGTEYDAKLQKWAIYNKDGASMPEGVSFNIAVSAGANEPAR